jgi:hypothetical protein
LHDADDGPVAKNGDEGVGICLKCGAPVDLPDPVVVGAKLPGGEPNPEALATPRRRSGGRGGPSRGGSSSTNGRRRARRAA